MTRGPGEPVGVPSPASSPGPRLGLIPAGDGQAAVHIVVQGTPVGKGRPRFVRSTGMAYTPLKTANYEAIIKAFGIDAMAGRRPLEGPLQVLVIAYMPVATTWSRKKTASALAGVIRPGRPDADNLLKAVADALNGVVWRDDAQIAEATISKRYDLRPRLEIEVSSLGG